MNAKAAQLLTIVLCLFFSAFSILSVFVYLFGRLPFCGAVKLWR